MIAILLATGGLLAVRDVDATVRFYQAVFGLEEIVNRTETEGIRWLALDEGRELHLISGFGEPPIPVKTMHYALVAPGTRTPAITATAAQ